MKLKISLVILFIIAFNINSHAQFGSVLKKKEKSAVTDSTATNTTKKSGSSFLQKALLNVAKVAGKVGGAATGAVTSTADLSQVLMTGGLCTNLLSKDIGLASMDYFSDWKGGYDWITIGFLPKDKLFWYNLDGKVTVDGVAFKNQGVGIYSAIVPPSAKDRKIEINTSTGQKAKFTFKKVEKAIKLVSINNNTTNCIIDNNTDFSIQLANLPSSADARISIEIAGSKMGIFTTFAVGNFKPAANITIPSYILKHISADSNINFKNSYLIVTCAEMETATDEMGTIPEALNYGQFSMSALPFTTVNKIEVFHGLVAKGEEKFPMGSMSYEFKKGNAGNARPQEDIKKIAVTSFAIQGSTAFYEEKTKYSGNDSYTTTTRSIDFPIKAEQLDPILADLYPKLTQIIADQYGAQFLPIEAVTKTPEFIAMSRYTKSDVGGNVNFSRCYKELEPKSFAIPLAGVFKGETTLFKPLQVDAILKVNISLVLDTKEGLIIPTMNVELLGKQSGFNFGYGSPTQFFTASIVGKGFSIPRKGNVTDAMMNQVVRPSDMLTLFKKGLSEIAAAESKNLEYVPIWNVQK